MMGSVESEGGKEEFNDYYVENTVFIAVGKQVKESESVLLWAVKKFAGKKRICILHVHQPAQLVTFFDAKLTTSKLKQRAVKAFRELDLQKLHKLVNQYVLLVSQTGVHADRMWIELDNVEEGIVKMIVQHGIKWLVMGAAADKHYTKEMADLKSQKAIFVSEKAPDSCHIWFVCKGNLIYTREARKDDPCVNISLAHQSLDSNVVKEEEAEEENVILHDHSSDYSVESQSLYSNAVSEEAENERVDTPSSDIVSSESIVATEESESESESESEVLTEGTELERVHECSSETQSLDSNVSTEVSEIARTDCMIGDRGSPPRLTFRERGSILRACSVDYGSHVENRMVLSSTQNPGRSNGGCVNEGKEGHEFERKNKMEIFKFHSSFNSALFEGTMGGKARLVAPRELHDRLERAVSDAENLIQTAFQEAVKRWKAEEDAWDAKNKAEAAEFKYALEVKQREELEEALEKQKQQCQKFKDEQVKYRRELPMVQHRCSELQNQIRESELTAKELEEKIISAVELLISFRGKRDQIELERDKAIQELESLRRMKQNMTAMLYGPQFTTFSLLEIGEATCSFDQSKRIGDGKYGSIYHGILRHIEVAIKMLPNDGSHGQWRFEYEVEVLSRVRHPNIVMLIGICPEARSLVYEYLARGSLEDHLSCKAKTPPLQWQTRVNIAAELCSALIFLHTNNPPIFHGNLKPTKILLDSNFVTKISDLGIFRLIPQDQIPTYDTYRHHTSVYIDPEFLETGVLTPHSDVYSFGVILVYLLTGRTTSGLVKDVKNALERDKLESMLDFSAGDWPISHAKKLAWLALRCCERNPSNRADLASEVLSVLEPLRKSCNSQALCFEKKENHRPPSHFLCPIYQEVMKDPHTAADGFTYEGDAIKGWFDSGHKTSPMTNLKLPNCDLIPNHALQFAIQEWLQRS